MEPIAPTPRREVREPSHPVLTESSGMIRRLSQSGRLRSGSHLCVTDKLLEAVSLEWIYSPQEPAGGDHSPDECDRQHDLDDAVDAKAIQ